MKATVEIEKGWSGYFATISINSGFINENCPLLTESCASKGQLKRKICQFCGDLNLEYEIIN
jgi:hypothetical protein